MHGYTFKGVSTGRLEVAYDSQSARIQHKLRR